MSENHLEQLLSEWYEYQGYFLRRNVQVAKRSNGGYDCELDIVGFHPQTRHVIHVEPSLDADSWATREARFSRKFDLGRKFIPEILKGFDLPSEIDQMAVFVFASTQNHQSIGGGRIVLASDIIEEIFKCLKGLRLESQAIPEHLPILRSFQYVSQYRNAVKKAWTTSK